MISTNGAHEVPKIGIKSAIAAPAPLSNALEGAACLRALVCFAKTNGSLTPDELTVLEEAWDKLALPATMTLPGLMSEDIDLTLQLALIVSEESRERTYTATYLFAHSGGPCSTKQQKLLNCIRASLHLSDKMATPLSRIHRELREMVFPSLSSFIPDPLKRLNMLDGEILKFALSNAVTGAFPIQVRSVASSVIIFSTQSAMVRDIGHLWGISIDKQTTQLLMASIQGETGMRIAIQSLLRAASLQDGTLGSTCAFVNTWALGIVSNKYFESGRKLTTEALRELFAQALVEGGIACETSKDEIATAVRSRSITLELLNEELDCGNINFEEFDRKIMGLQ